MNDLLILNIETFYKTLQCRFPDLLKLSVWAERDWRNDSLEHSGIITSIAEEMISWGENGSWQNVTALLNEVEVGFTKGDKKLVAYLGTDFTVTITECKNVPLREHIKKLMGPLTFNNYQLNLGGYREAL